MKRLIIFPLILILTACTSGQNTGVTPPINAMSAEPSVVKTPTPEKIETPSVTATENPLANAPDGATRVSADGATYYKDVVDPVSGKTIIEIYTEFKNIDGKVLWSGWTVDKTPGKGIPLIDFAYEDLNSKDVGFIKLLCATDADICQLVPHFTHVSKTDEDGLDNDLATRSSIDLYTRTHNGQEGMIDEMTAFITSLNDGIKIPVDISGNGELSDWVINQNENSASILVPYDSESLDGAIEFDLGGQRTTKIKFLGVTKEGKLIGVMGISSPVPVEDYYAWHKILLLQTSIALEFQDVSKPHDFLRVLDSLSFLANHKSSHGNMWAIIELDK